MLNKYIEKLIKKYPEFNFSEFEYKNSYTKSKIICKKHGEFLEIIKNEFRRF